MATIPDTPQIADALATLAAAGDAAQILSAAVNRLRVLHQLGATEEQTAAVLRADRDTKAEEVATITAECDALSADKATLTAQVAALEAQVAALTPLATHAIPVTEFRARLIPLRLALLSAPDVIRAKWAVLLNEVDHFTTLDPTDPRLSWLIGMTVTDQLLKQEQADELSAPLSARNS